MIFPLTLTTTPMRSAHHNNQSDSAEIQQCIQLFLDSLSSVSPSPPSSSSQRVRCLPTHSPVLSDISSCLNQACPLHYGNCCLSRTLRSQPYSVKLPWDNVCCDWALYCCLNLTSNMTLNPSPALCLDHFTVSPARYVFIYSKNKVPLNTIQAAATLVTTTGKPL